MSILKTSIKAAAPLAAMAMVAACTTATPYQPLGASRTEGGFVDQQLDQTHFRVTFFGNSLTSRQQVEDYLLYRAAELTAQRGFNCFTMVNHGTDKKTTIQTFGGYRGGYYPGWSPYWSMHGPWGWYRYDPWLGDPFFPGGYDINTIDRYQATADIAVGNNCAAGPSTFDARQVMQNLQPRIVYPQQR